MNVKINYFIFGVMLLCPTSLIFSAEENLAKDPALFAHCQSSDEHNSYGYGSSHKGGSFGAVLLYEPLVPQETLRDSQQGYLAAQANCFIHDLVKQVEDEKNQDSFEINSSLESAKKRLFSADPLYEFVFNNKGPKEAGSTIAYIQTYLSFVQLKGDGQDHLNFNGHGVLVTQDRVSPFMLQGQNDTDFMGRIYACMSKGLILSCPFALENEHMASKAIGYYCKGIKSSVGLVKEFLFRYLSGVDEPARYGYALINVVEIQKRLGAVSGLDGGIKEIEVIEFEKEEENKEEEKDSEDVVENPTPSKKSGPATLLPSIPSSLPSIGSPLSAISSPMSLLSRRASKSNSLKPSQKSSNEQTPSSSPSQSPISSSPSASPMLFSRDMEEAKNHENGDKK